MYKKILVAVDGSESSTNALLQAFKFATVEKCWITVVSIVPPYDEIEVIGVRDVGIPLMKAEESLREAQKLADTERVLVKIMIEEGEVHERIVDLADAENCDLIIMGARGLSPLERILVGKVTARVIGHSQRDVLVAPNLTSIGWKTFVLATDGSKFSIVAAERAISFAKSHGAELKILSVVDVPAEFHALAPQAVEGLVRKARVSNTGIKKQAETAGVAAETFVTEGEADTSIILFAREQKADMIIIGSHGRTGLRRLLMGSVAEKVIGRASCPVLVVK